MRTHVGKVKMNHKLLARQLITFDITSSIFHSPEKSPHVVARLFVYVLIIKFHVHAIEMSIEILEEAHIRRR